MRGSLGEYCVSCGVDDWYYYIESNTNRRCAPCNLRITERSRVEREYGITMEDYQSLLDRQNGKCALCGFKPREDQRRLHIDHDHETGKVRGLLCGQCNKALGRWGDDINGLQRVVRYLQEPHFHHSVQSLVYEWERKAGFNRPALPELPSDSVAQHRIDFISEELDELIYALHDMDLVSVADALGDILWVTYGTAHACGIDLDAVVEEIARSNYTKLSDNDTLGDGDDRKVSKGPNYEPPELEYILESQEPLY